jgi:hypothetical protein
MADEARFAREITATAAQAISKAIEVVEHRGQTAAQNLRDAQQSLEKSEQRCN